MTTGMSGTYRWTAVDAAVPPENTQVLLCRMTGPNAVVVEEGERDAEGSWWSARAGLVEDVTHWTLPPEPPSMLQVRRTYAAVHFGMEDGRPPRRVVI